MSDAAFLQLLLDAPVTALASHPELRARTPDRWYDIVADVVRYRTGDEKAWAPAVRALWLNGLEPDEIAALLACARVDVEVWISRHDYSERGRWAIDQHHLGLTAGQIAEVLGVSRIAVRKWLIEAGFDPNSRKSPTTTPEQRDEIVRRRIHGDDSNAEIARQMGLTVDQVGYALRLWHAEKEG